MRATLYDMLFPAYSLLFDEIHVSLVKSCGSISKVAVGLM